MPRTPRKNARIDAFVLDALRLNPKDPWAEKRAVIAKHRMHARAARQQARYDVDALETAAYHDAEAERLEAELEAAGHKRPRGARYRRNAELGPLGQQLTDLMDALFADFSAPHAHEVSRWMRSNMMIFGRAPARAKNIQGQMEKLAELLSEVPKWGAAQNQPFYKGVWQNIVPFLGEVEALALKEAVVKEVQVDGNTFINEAGLSPDNFDKYVKAMSSLFAQVQGWRRGAFTDGATVVFAGPKAFRGTAGGVYRWKQDQLFVRATPAVLKRSSGTYGALDYIIIHELGHRFERKHRLPEDFNKVEWTTTKYSQKEGEAFAELFALGHFGMETVHGDTFGDRLARFEAVMSGSRTNPRRRPRRNDASSVALTRALELTGVDRERYVDAVWSMYVASYSKIGLIVENAEDLLDEYDVWEISVDDAGVPRAFCLYKRTQYGLKTGLSGSDGSPAGRATARASLSTKFHRPGVYGEVSHRPAELARAAGVPVVCANVAAVVLRKDVEPVDAIHYVRNLVNVGPVEKMLVGKPLGVPTTDIEQPYCPAVRTNPRQRPTPDDVADLDAHYASLVGF